jgi:GNAT superfamily N-acetyltransferase
MPFNIRSLDGSFNTKSFSCGEPALDAYLQCYAKQDIKRGVARIYIASTIGEPQRVVGFYSLSATSVAADNFPEVMRKKLPRYPIPVALIGRLAVDEQAQGKGLGSILLVDACKRVLAASQILAVAAIVVDAKSPQAAAFYQHFGFIELPGQQGRWMLPYSAFDNFD